MINDYTRRKVAVQDTQACYLCHKPTNVVLYNQSGPDWFYTCELHLQNNPQFAVPVYGAEYESILKKMKETKELLNKQVTSKGGVGNWDGWVNKLISSRKSKDDDKEADKKDDQKEDTQDAERQEPDLQKQYDMLLDKLTEIKSKNKKYKLSDMMFQNRVDLKERERLRRIRIQKKQEQYSNTDPLELETKFQFPSIPQTTPNKKV